MTPSRPAWRHYGAALSMVTIVAAFWSWALIVGRLSVETRGFGGYVTALLWTLHLFGVPLAGLLALLTGLLGARRHRLSRRFAAGMGVLVATTLAFWWWSIVKAGG